MPNNGLQILKDKYSGKVRFNFPIKRITTLKIGGKARAVAVADTVEKLVEVLGEICKLRLPYFVIAGGSNLLFSDKGFYGVVVHYTANKLDCYKREIEVDGGYNLPKLIRDLANKNLGGVDFLGNIPGSVGGAVVGNAGCYGKWIGDFMISATVFDMKTGKIKTMSPKDFKFKYRESICKQKPNLVLMRVRLGVIPTKKQDILKAVTAELAERHRKHPRQPSAGSFFKNMDGQPTWKLIDAVGLRGHQIGGAKVSTKHPNFIVNVGGARASDVIKLVNLIKKRVKQLRKIELETEVRMVDEFGRVG